MIDVQRPSSTQWIVFRRAASCISWMMVARKLLTEVLHFWKPVLWSTAIPFSYSALIGIGRSWLCSRCFGRSLNSWTSFFMSPKLVLSFTQHWLDLTGAPFAPLLFRKAKGLPRDSRDSWLGATFEVPRNESKFINCPWLQNQPMGDLQDPIHEATYVPYVWPYFAGICWDIPGNIGLKK